MSKGVCHYGQYDFALNTLITSIYDDQLDRNLDDAIRRPDTYSILGNKNTIYKKNCIQAKRAAFS